MYRLEELARGWCGWCKDMEHTATGRCYCLSPCEFDHCPQNDDGSNPFEVSFL